MARDLPPSTARPGELIEADIAPADAEAESSCSLYRHYDADGALLYVGISVNPVQRTSEHQQMSPWFGQIRTITIEAFPSRTAAQAAERTAIRIEQPQHNRLRPIEDADQRIATSVRLPPEIMEGLKVLAVRQRVRVNDALVAAARQYLAAHGMPVQPASEAA